MNIIAGALIAGFLVWFAMSISSPWIFYGQRRPQIAAQIMAVVFGLLAAVDVLLIGGVL